MFNTFSEMREYHGHRLHVLRASIGLSLNKMAKLLPMSSMNLAKIEKGITSLKLEYICELETYGINALEFIVGKSELILIDDINVVQNRILEALEA